VLLVTGENVMANVDESNTPRLITVIVVLVTKHINDSDKKNIVHYFSRGSINYALKLFEKLADAEIKQSSYETKYAIMGIKEFPSNIDFRILEKFGSVNLDNYKDN
jgi:hypothetical protein